MFTSGVVDKSSKADMPTPHPHGYLGKKNPLIIR